MKKSLIQLIKFGIVGGINTVLSYLIYLGGLYLGIHYLIASTIGFIITVFISYVLNSLLTFRESGEAIHWSIKALIKVYISYSITGFILGNLLLFIEVDVIKISEMIAPIINLFITIPTNFILNKFWAYKESNINGKVDL